jgi:hypothetical protein
MLPTRSLLLTICVGLGIACQAARAHHSEVASFDLNAPVKVTGKISSVRWENPHVWFFVDVTDKDGKVTTWGFSSSPPGALLRQGVTKDRLQPGTIVSVEGMRARDGSDNASARRVTTLDGKNVLAPPER